MSSTKPVVVYGASGYTGRLVCEYLREFCVPFIAAGRDKTRIQAALDSIPGINTVDHEVVEVDHEVGPLSDLFAQAKVVCNTVGPFARHGHQVIKACMRAGTHYMDTTGEQDWLIECDGTYGAEMAAKGLLLAPGTAQMYTTGEIAANLCLETPGLDTLDILVFWKGAPTIASTQTILVNAAMSKAYYLQQNEYVEWPSDGGLYDVAVPGQHQTELALPWGGTSHPVWFKHDPRVANVKALGGVFNRQLMQGVPLIVKSALERVQGLPDDEKYAALSAVASSVQNQMPPRENARINTSLDSVYASGPLGRAHCVIHGNCNYKQTALMQAFAAYSLLQQPPRRVGFASACQALGHRELLGVLQCLWYGAAPMSATRLKEAIDRIGPVLGQLFGQTEAPMMISTMAPKQHVHADGSLARERFSSAGRPTPLVNVAIMDEDGNVLPTGERGEIVVRSSLVMAGYYKNPSATEESGRFGWHHTGDIGYLDADNYLFIVDRAKDMIITGGFNVYSAEVEQALMEHPAVQDCAVVGLPDDMWGERVTAVVQLRPGYSVTESEVRAFVKARIGSVKAPKQVDVWPDLPKSTVGKVLKSEVKAQLLNRSAQEDQ